MNYRELILDLYPDAEIRCYDGVRLKYFYVLISNRQVGFSERTELKAWKSAFLEITENFLKRLSA